MNFTALDFETANGNRASACAVGMAKVVDDEVVDRFTTLIRPAASVSHFSTRNVEVHGIRPARVWGAPRWAEAYAQMMAFAGGDTLVAHNAPFEASVLRQACELEGIDFPEPPIVCTLRAARTLLHLEKNTLPVVTAHLGLPGFDHHEACADAIAAALIAVELGRRFGTREFGKAGLLPVKKKEKQWAYS